MSIPALTEFADLVAEHLLNGLILSGGIFVGADILLPVCFRADRWSAATRHWVSLLTFVLVASTPLLVALRPAQPSRVVHSAQAAKNDVTVNNVPSSPLMGRLIREPISLERKAPPIVKAGWLENVDWLLLLFTGWALASFVCGVRLLSALYRLRVLHRSAQPVALAEQLPSSRRITIAESSLVSSPVAVGLWSAKVLLPAGFQSQFSATERRNVLLHEIAHLERLDDWSTFLQQVLLAAFPINPFLWAANRILHLHQEAACDDRVLIETQQAKSYAHLLARLADGNIERSLLAPGVSRQGKQLYQRLTRILDGTLNRNVRPSVCNVMTAGIALIGASVAGLVWLPVIACTPTVRASESENVIVGPDGAEITRSSLDPEIISLLTSSALNDPDPSVRQEATFALSEHEGSDVTAALLALFNQSKDEQIRLTILHGMTPRRAADPRVKEKLNDLALHETSVPIRTAAIELLSKNLDGAAINQLIAIYRTADSLIIKSACLRGLTGADSKTAREFLISIAKADPDPQLRRVALRAIAGDTEIVQRFVLNGKHIALPPDELQQQTDVYRRKLDGIERLRDEAGAVISRRVPPPGDLPPENRFFAPHLKEGFGPRPQSPDSPKQFPDEPKVDPSPKPSPSVSE
ncbi:MAG: HEAT repeat domain-containing protein [Verrucomicrobia bacterium]|nr:HEAT repeat domain-containing protein [Verrucomicrobiota bacterium]MBV8277616.1 HEAT repeat domain-containing protein [Verrucomicrobiota bacterium]